MDRNWAERLSDARILGLTKRESDLIEYISSQPQEAAFLRQSELSSKAGVSKPVVISCFRRMGYADYQEFLEGLQGFYAGQIDSAQASSVAFKDVTSVAGLVSQALKVEAATLETLERHLDPIEVEALARALIEAPSVCLYAEGSGFLPAHYLSQRLRRCGLSVALIGGDRPHVLDDLAQVRPRDVFLTFFYTQDGPLMADILDFVKTRGAISVLVTGTPDPELYRRADHHLFVPRGQWNFKNSLAAPMAFAQILLLTVEYLGGPELQTRLKDLESTRKRFGSPKKGEES